MNEPETRLRELLDLLGEDEIIRLKYRAEKANKPDLAHVLTIVFSKYERQRAAESRRQELINLLQSALRKRDGK